MKKKAARKLLAECVQRESTNETAWLWLSVCADTTDQKQFCLEKALQINPNNAQSRRALEKLLAVEQPSLEMLIPEETKKESKTFESLVTSKAQTNRSLEFIVAKCPNCGSELRVPENRDKMKCAYCGYDVILHDPNLIRVETKIDTARILELARVAEDGDNLAEAYRLYSQVLEYDSKNVRAWIGKGYSAGLQSISQTPRFTETASCLKEALTIGVNDHETKKFVALRISAVAMFYTKFIAQEVSNYLRQVELDRRSKDIGGLWLVSILNSEAKKLSPTFTQIHAPIIRDFLSTSWQLYKDIQIAERIYAFINAVKEAAFVTNEGTTTIVGWFSSEQKEIASTLPNWQPPKAKKKQNICFIATATMGDYDHPYVMTLRKFRDENLLGTTLGNWFIAFYYQCSPPIARLIESSTILRTLSLRFIIKPCVVIVRQYMNKRNSTSSSREGA